MLFRSEGVDAVIMTHTHEDHWDETAQQAVPKNLPIFVQHESDAGMLRTQGFKDVRILHAQVSDAGTPAVCDPGAKLTRRVREAGFKVVPVVGASAVMGALSVAGVTEPNFYFNGFLPPKSGERQKLLAKWAQADFPVVMFETPHRIEATLADMAALFPERSLTLAREITKTFETFLSGTVTEIQTTLKNDSNQAREEMVLILHPALREKHDTLPDVAQNVMKILVAELPTKQAAELAAKITGEGKKALYDLALEWKRVSDDV